MRRRIVAAILAIPLMSGPAGAATWMEGVAAHVRDGDTIVVGGRPLRLWGLHAPELHEPGGAAARRWMIDNALGRRLVCRLDGRRSRDRLVAACFNEAGDVAAQLVAAGLGRDCPRFSAGAYAGLETESGRRLALPGYCQPRDDARRHGATRQIAARGAR